MGTFRVINAWILVPCSSTDLTNDVLLSIGWTNSWLMMNHQLTHDETDIPSPPLANLACLWDYVQETMSSRALFECCGGPIHFQQQGAAHHDVIQQLWLTKGYLFLSSLFVALRSAALCPLTLRAGPSGSVPRWRARDARRTWGDDTPRARSSREISLVQNGFWGLVVGNSG